MHRAKVHTQKIINAWRRSLVDDKILLREERHFMPGLHRRELILLS